MKKRQEDGPLGMSEKAQPDTEGRRRRRWSTHGEDGIHSGMEGEGRSGSCSLLVRAVVYWWPAKYQAKLEMQTSGRLG